MSEPEQSGCCKGTRSFLQKHGLNVLTFGAFGGLFLVLSGLILSLHLGMNQVNTMEKQVNTMEKHLESFEEIKDTLRDMRKGKTRKENLNSIWRFRYRGKTKYS